MFLKNNLQGGWESSKAWNQTWHANSKVCDVECLCAEPVLNLHLQKSHQSLATVGNSGKVNQGT